MCVVRRVLSGGGGRGGRGGRYGNSGFSVFGGGDARFQARNPPPPPCPARPALPVPVLHAPLGLRCGAACRQ